MPNTFLHCLNPQSPQFLEDLLCVALQQERRQAEEAEAAAKEEAHKRRVESLKAWMATVYVKMRKQREQQSEQAAAQRQVERSPAQSMHQQGQQGGLQGESQVLR